MRRSQSSEEQINYNQALIKAGRRPEDSEFYIHIPTHATYESFEEIRNKLAAPMRLFLEVAASGGTVYDSPANSRKKGGTPATI
jgi:hypothetical protein